jgi:hypothetical protein
VRAAASRLRRAAGRRLDRRRRAVRGPAAGAAVARPWSRGTKGLPSGRRWPRRCRRRRLEPYASAARISAVARTRPRRGRMFSTEKR